MREIYAAIKKHVSKSIIILMHSKSEAVLGKILKYYTFFIL